MSAFKKAVASATLAGASLAAGAAAGISPGNGIFTSPNNSTPGQVVAPSVVTTVFNHAAYLPLANPSYAVMYADGVSFQYTTTQPFTAPVRIEMATTNPFALSATSLSSKTVPSASWVEMFNGSVNFNAGGTANIGFLNPFEVDLKKVGQVGSNPSRTTVVGTAVRLTIGAPTVGSSGAFLTGIGDMTGISDVHTISQPYAITFAGNSQLRAAWSLNMMLFGESLEPAVAVVPEPWTVALFGAGLLAVGAAARRNRAASDAKTAPTV